MHKKFQKHTQFQKHLRWSWMTIRGSVQKPGCTLKSSMHDYLFAFETRLLWLTCSNRARTQEQREQERERQCEHKWVREISYWIVYALYCRHLRKRISQRLDRYYKSNAHITMIQMRATREGEKEREREWSVGWCGIILFFYFVLFTFIVVGFFFSQIIFLNRWIFHSIRVCLRTTYK